ncbi:MAG TPA: hypothetical protein PKD05_25360 [Candidatus Melainabacteria bacterium]|nr:hypothetical protein [Candidatus Melainabacteria bacterium]
MPRSSTSTLATPGLLTRGVEKPEKFIRSDLTGFTGLTSRTLTAPHRHDEKLLWIMESASNFYAQVKSLDELKKYCS